MHAKREAKERVKELSRRINAANAERLAAAAPAKPKPKEPSARQRAVDYARASVPRPELLKQRSGSGARSGKRSSKSGSEVRIVLAGPTTGARFSNNAAYIKSECEREGATIALRQGNSCISHAKGPPLSGTQDAWKNYGP